MRSRFWADHRAPEIAALDRASLIAVLPVGAIEQHGPHLPLSTDAAIVDAVVAAALPHLPEDCPALFLPTLPVGKSDEHAAWPGTLTLSAVTLIAMWTEIGDSVAAAGVRKFVILNSHGGQMAAMDVVVRDLRARHGMLAVAASWFAMGLPEGLYPLEEERFGIHAGRMETSVMLAAAPGDVDMGEARDFGCWAADLAAGGTRHLGLGPGGRFGWLAQDMNPAGACGNAAAARAEDGRATLDHAGRALARLLAEVQGVDMARLAGAPEGAA